MQWATLRQCWIDNDRQATHRKRKKEAFHHSLLVRRPIPIE
jgi:hypothetical protein